MYQEDQVQDQYGNAEALLKAFENADLCVFMYYPQTKSIDVPENACRKYCCQPAYDNMPASFADDFVHDDDREAFFAMYRKIDEGAPSASASFHSKDRSACCRVTLTAIHWSKGDPAKEVLGIIEDVSEWDRERELARGLQERLDNSVTDDSELMEARDGISTAIGSQYYALYYIWLDRGVYVCYQEQLPGILSVIGVKGEYKPAWESYIANYVEADDRPALAEFADFDTLAERLRGANVLTHEYRRQEVGWTRGQFIAAKRAEDGTVQTAVYTVVDINAEKTLEASRQKALYESFHDPLTGVYNRKGFREITAVYLQDRTPVGFAIVDVDYFKTVNDNFGHEEGDEVLKEVAGLLNDMFRVEDTVFRLGGDEFAVLLRNCPASAWETLCEKQRRIHAALDGRFKDTGITLSVGIAFSAQGFSQEVYRQADSMLYEAKRRGRAGSASADMDAGTCRYWQDQGISRKAQNVLSFNSAGLYRIEFPLDRATPPRLFCDDASLEILGFAKEITPEECFQEWRSRIEPSYLQALGEMRHALDSGIQAECTYQWDHPTHGRIFIRTGGTGDVVDGVQVLYGYHHSMEDTKVLERKDDGRLLIDAMSGIYFASYYIDLDNDSFSVMKNAPGERFLEMQHDRASVTLEQFLSTLVSEGDRSDMRRFMDLGTIRDRLTGEVHLDHEYLSDSDKGWCRATFFPVKHDAAGRLTHVLFVITSLDAARAQEARQKAEDRKSIEALYNNVPGGIIMYEWDGNRLKTLHISAHYEREYGYTLNAGPDGEKGPDFSRVHPDDLAGYQAAIQHALAVTHELHYEYRVWNRAQEAYLWTRMDAVASAEPNGKVLVYALYTDVTSQHVMLEDYEHRMDSILAAVENSLVVGQSNLTQDTVVFFEATEEMRLFTEGIKRFDERFGRAAQFVLGSQAREEFLATFNRANLLKRAAEGKMSVRLEYLLRVPGHRTVWLSTVVRMVKNPLTGDIMAISYSRSIQEARLSSMLLKSTLGQEYLKTVVVLAESGEFYALDNRDDMSGECQYGFWDRLMGSLLPILDLPREEMEKLFGREAILAKLDADGEFVYSFDSSMVEVAHRMQVRFSYLQKAQGLVLVSMRNITDEALMARLRHESEHDPLTDLYNRRTVFRKCREMLNAYPDEDFAMVHVDMKRFRLFNTFFGDEEGDKLLCDVADMLRWMDKDYDHWVYGRIEADVFCACFPFSQERYSQHLAEAFAQLKDYRKDFSIEPVIGMFMVTDRSMPVEAMFTRATLAAKYVRDDSPDATMVYDESLERQLNAEQQIINDMQAAIDLEQFQVYLQPKYALRTNKPVGAEALVRWAHPERGMISPGAFIPVFERNGFISELDRYMWEHVCQLLRKWQDQGRPLAPVSVNVSRLSMFGTDTVEFLKDLVARYGIEPKYLELELTESAYIDDPREMIQALRELRAAGFRILLDDFGSGYSSLNTLRELPVDVLKLDLRFLPLEADDLRAGLVVSSIVRMSKLLGLTVIAEGVERQEHAEFLKGIGCEYVQGFLYARPMPVADYEQLLAAGDEASKANEPVISHIGRILADTGTGTHSLGTVIPSALAFMEYRNGDFAFLRVNPEFFDEFGLAEDLSPAAGVFKRSLTEASLERLLAAFERSVQTGVKQQVCLRWRCADGSVRKYMCRLAYEGMLGASASIVAVFTNTTDCSDCD